MMQKNPRKNFDLTEEESKRKDGEATIAAREAESDDLNEETNNGPIISSDDKIVENEVWTSSSDE